MRELIPPHKRTVELTFEIVSEIKEIKDIEKIGKRIDIILENGNRLTIYDIEENSLS